MRIVPINNNLSLKGSFQNSELMQKAVVHATTEELVKFNEILERAHLIDDKKVFFENGKICALSADGIVAGAADSKALFIHYTEPLNTVYESDKFFAVDTRTECPRLVQLIPGDEWMSTDANCAIEGRIIKVDTEGKEGWYGVSTMANGDTGYHYVFLG